MGGFDNSRFLGVIEARNPKSGASRVLHDLVCDHGKKVVFYFGLVFQDRLSY